MVQPVIGTIDNIIGEFDLARANYETAKCIFEQADKTYRYWTNQTLNFMQLMRIQSVSVNGLVYYKRGNYIEIVGTTSATDQPTAPIPFPTCAPLPSPTLYPPTCEYFPFVSPTAGPLPEYTQDGYSLASDLTELVDEGTEGDAGIIFGDT